MTFDKIELQFDRQCYVIKGKNEDDNGQESNGSGKTSLLDIIAVALLGESLTGRDLKNCINWSGTESFFTVSVMLFNGVEEDENRSQTIITRKVYSNTRSAELSILIDGRIPKGVLTKAGIENGVDTKEGNKYILDTILGISKEDLLSYFLISGDEYQSFFSVNNTKKMEIISRFSKAQKVDKVIERLSKELKSFESDLQNYTSILSNLEGQLTSLSGLVDQQATKAFELKKETDLASILLQITALEHDRDSLVYQKVIGNRHLDEQIEEKEMILKELYQLGIDLTSIRRGKEKQIAILETFVAGEIECPKCNHSFILDNNKSITELVCEIDLLEQQVKQSHSDESETTSTYKEIESELYTFKEQKKKIEQAEYQNSLIEKRANDLQQTISRKEQELLEIDARVFDDGGIRERIEKVQKQKDEIENKSICTNMEIGTYSMWIERFKQFKFYLANKPVEIICHYANQFLQKLGSDLSISIEGFKVLKNGELKAELTPLVYRNQINPQSYSSFSGGERVRLNLAADLALQRLINENSSEGLEFYSNDEACSALDSLGLLHAAKAFNNLHQTICIVSHSGADLMYDNVVTVIKNNGKSEIR